MRWHSWCHNICHQSLRSKETELRRELLSSDILEFPLSFISFCSSGWVFWSCAAFVHGFLPINLKNPPCLHFTLSFFLSLFEISKFRSWAPNRKFYTVQVIEHQRGKFQSAGQHHHSHLQETILNVNNKATLQKDNLNLTRSPAIISIIVNHASAE